MAQTVAPYFAIGNEQAYYKYAQDLTLILADGALKQVVFTYKTYGIEETVTLTFDFNTAFDVKTDLGLDFENASKTSVLDDYIGQYKDNEGNFLTVDKSGFTLNGSKSRSPNITNPPTLRQNILSELGKTSRSR